MEGLNITDDEERKSAREPEVRNERWIRWKIGLIWYGKEWDEDENI